MELSIVQLGLGNDRDRRRERHANRYCGWGQAEPEVQFWEAKTDLARLRRTFRGTLLWVEKSTKSPQGSTAVALHRGPRFDESALSQANEFPPKAVLGLALASIGFVENGF